MRLLTRRLLPLVLILLTFGLIPTGVVHAGAASARFKSPHPISLEINRKLLMDSNGNAHIVQANNDGDIRYLSIPKGKSPTAPVTLIPSQVGNLNADFTVAIDGSNRIHIVWTTSDGTIHYVTRSSNGTLSSPLIVSQQVPDLYGVRLAVEPGGRAHITWTDANGQGQVARIVNGQIGVPLSTGAGRIQKIAADTAGTLHVVYYNETQPSPPLDTIYYNTITLNGTLGSPLTLGLHEDNGSVGYPEEVLVAPNGATHLLLGSFDDSDDPGTLTYMLIRPNGVTTTADLGLYFGRARGVLDAKGRIHIAYTVAIERDSDDPPYPLYNRELHYAIYKDGAFEKGSTYAKNTSVVDIAIAMGPDNKSTVIWQEYQQDVGDRVIARRPGSTTPRTIFSAEGGYGIQLATAPDGGAVALWSPAESPNSLYASTYK